MPAEGTLTEVQLAVVFTWIDVLEKRVARDWLVCGPSAMRAEVAP